MPTAIIFHCFEFVENVAQIAEQRLLGAGVRGFEAPAGALCVAETGMTSSGSRKIIGLICIRNILLCI